MIKPPPSNEASGKIVYTCQPEAYRQICILDAASGAWELLSNDPVDHDSPVLTSDGNRLSYVINLKGRYEIRLRGLADGNDQQLMEDRGSAFAPQVSPDGIWLLFGLQDAGDKVSVWKVRIGSSLAHRLTEVGISAGEPSWSPDGQEIALLQWQAGIAGIFVTSQDGSEMRKVETGEIPIGGLGCWSPDKHFLAFHGGKRGERDIYITEAAEGDTRRLTFGGNNLYPCFSPDGEWITFSSSRDGDHEIYIMRLDGSHLTQLTDNRSNDWQPRWGP